MSHRSWIALAESIGTYLGEQATQRPNTVTFLLGAGASRSSGAPSTKKILERLTERYPEQFPNGEVSEDMDWISDPQIEGTVAPLFDRVSPHIGYLSLATLAKSTRVLIVNLNWDRAVEIACERVGVSCASLVIDEQGKLDEDLAKVVACLEDEDCRVVNLHLHGRLPRPDAGDRDEDRTDIRFSVKKTLAFQSKTTQLLWNSFFNHPTIVLGATLTGERDVTGLIAASAQLAEPRRKPLWLFSRQGHRTKTPQDRVVARMVSLSEADLNFRGDPFIDFDRAMVEIVAKRVGRPVQDQFKETGISAVDRDRIVFPSPDLLRGYLAKPRPGGLVALVGERRIGRSTTAALLAHWAALLSEHAGVKVCRRSGRRDCGDLARRLIDSPSSCGAPGVVIFDDPFDLADAASGDAFVRDLARITNAGDAPQVIVTASLSNWHHATSINPALADVEVILERPSGWYRDSDLASLADDPSSTMPAMVTRRVVEGVASTPARVRPPAQGGSRREKGARYAKHDEEVIADKLALLHQLDADTQTVLAIIRFRELLRTVAPEVGEESEVVGSVDRLPLCVKAMLRSFQLDGAQHFLFDHYTDRVAFDRLYREKDRELRSAIVDAAFGSDVVDEVCNIWLTITQVREGELGAISRWADGNENTRNRLVEWGPVLLEEAAYPKSGRQKLDGVLRQLLKVHDRRDFWALRELVYEVVRLWPEFHQSQLARKFIKQTLADVDRMGCYCVIESLLYYERETHRDVWDRDYALHRLWDRVTGALSDLMDDASDRGTELSLIFDAVVWSPPPFGKREFRAWVDRILYVLDKHDGLKGAVAFALLYHPAGAKIVEELGIGSALADIQNLNEEQMTKAAQMVCWQWVHQSRARALLSRRRLEPDYPEQLGQEARENPVPTAHADKIEQFIRRMARFPALRGWAVHLAFNLRCSVGKFDVGFLRDIFEQLEPGDGSVVVAAYSYAVPSGVQEQVYDYFGDQTNRELLLNVMLTGWPVESLWPSANVRVHAPRFMAGRSPWDVHRDVDTQWHGALKDVPADRLTDRSFPFDVDAVLTEGVRKGFLDNEAKLTLLRHVRRGDLRRLERTHARKPVDQSESEWLKTLSELGNIVVSAARDIASEPPTLL